MSKQYNFQRVFEVRTAVCFFIIMLCFLSCILRITVIVSGDYREAQQKQSSYRLEIGKLRGTIYDCNRIPITNSYTKEIAAVIPDNYSYTRLSKAVEKEKTQEINELIRGGGPFLTEVNHRLDYDTVASTAYYVNSYENMPATHLIGYTDSSGHGVSGLQKAYDSLLYSEKTAAAVLCTDGLGNVLAGDGIKIENDTSVIADGIVTTIDINIQLIAEDAARGLEKGAVVIADAETAQIRAMVSRPNFDVTNPEKSLSNEDSPFYNRATGAYNVGSAFKPCVAAAAIEAKKSQLSVTCMGWEEIADRKFNCHKKSGHGMVNLKNALSESCNVFFYNLALKIGGDTLYSMASSLGFGQSLKLATGYHTAKGNLTSKSVLSNEAELANLSIGQGRLLLSPVSMLTLYCAVATDGSYKLPSVVKGILKDGEYKATVSSAATRVMSADTAQTIREYLKEVVSSGTGKDAKAENTTCAGKTATAQTGKYKNGVEITHSWFCGFFPADQPKYVMIVMHEGGTGTAKIFAQIAEKMTEMGY